MQQAARFNKDYNKSLNGRLLFHKKKPIILNLSPQKRLKKSNSPQNGKNQALLGNFWQKRDFSVEKRPKTDHFSEEVSFRDQSLLKETELGALRWFNFPK